MRARLSAIMTVWIAGACASAPTGAGGSGGSALCELIGQRIGATSIHFPSEDALRAAARPAGLGDAICAQDDPACQRGVVFAYADADGLGEHALVVSTDAGFEGYPGLFVAGAGACCRSSRASASWDPETTVRGSSKWLVVRHVGDAYICADRECREDGVLAQFAVLERATGRLAFAITCPHSPNAQLIVSGEQFAKSASALAREVFVLNGCQGRDLTFGPRQLLACLAP